MSDTETSYRLIFEFLRDAIGLDPASIGVANVVHVIEGRQAATGCADVESYLACLQTQAEEHRALLEHIVVNETWFFRDQMPFELLKKEAVLRRFGKDEGRGAMRLLSLPCSTGEEAYSMAITMQQAGWRPGEYDIDAVDLSRAALALAETGCFQWHSFRGMDASFCEQWFTPAEGGLHKIDPGLKQGLRFFADNLIAPTQLLGVEIYDVVFCRNLLIYLDADALEKAFRVLRRLIKPEGILVVGHAESGLVPSPFFSKIEGRGAFAFRKLSGAPANLPPPATRRVMPSVSTPLPKTAMQAEPKKLERVEPTRQDAVPAMELTEIRRLADAGRYAEVTSALATYLRRHPVDATAHCLQGVVAMAEGRIAEAEAALRKAVYLDPKNVETLMQLALVLGARDKNGEAERLRDRAARMQGAISGAVSVGGTQR